MGFKFEERNGSIYCTCVSSGYREKIGKSALVESADCKSIILSVDSSDVELSYYSMLVIVLSL